MPVDEVNGQNSTKSTTRRRPSRRWCLRAGVVVVLLGLAGTLAVLYHLNVFTPTRVKYSIMFDAGSTGSRMHVFKFEIDAQDEIRLVNETYYKISPGLSDFANDPPKGALSLKSMLDKARATVPASEQHLTPIALKATAGLRLLPEIVQLNLLEEVRTLFERYPFQFEHSSVDIMDGKDEGYFAWLMVVFTLGRRLDKNPVATLDLGGGSTQVTFQPKTNETLAKADHLNYFKIPGGKKQQMYVHSYLGGGLMFGRAEMLKKSGFIANETHYTVNSPCVHPDVNRTDGGLYWEYFGVNFEIQPDNDGHFSFDACYPLAKSYVKEMKVFAPKELSNLELYLMSYYYDRAVDAGLIEEDVEMQKDLTVGDYRKAADFECRHYSKRLHRNEFLCLDLTYIYALLHEGLKLHDDTVITVAQQLRGSAVSWALGAALSEIKL